MIRRTSWWHVVAWGVAILPSELWGQSDMAKPAMGFRQIHLDFHTGPLVPDVGSRFDARRFAATVKAANVDSITLFAKCHHGHLYYDTGHPARHPSLPEGLNLLGEQIAALHAEGIRTPIYLSVQCDEYAANTHPEWIARNPDGTNVGPNPLQPGWQILDMSSPYLAYLQDQLAEVLEKFKPVDGIFLDMCWNQVSVSQWAKAGMLKAGLNPEKAEDRAEYSRQVSHSYMKTLHDQVRKAAPKASVYFNSRPLTGLAGDLKYMSHVEIEALPTGGWGYMYFPMNVRYVRSFGVPYLGMTSRFHKSWADFGGLKPEAALRYEVSQMIAHGAGCSIGDQLHPRGTLDEPAWEMIGRVYGHVKACQPWCEGATSAADVAVIRCRGGDHPVPAGNVDEGVVRMFMQLKVQFDLVAGSEDLSRYALIVLPDGTVVDEGLSAALDACLARGGAVFLTGRSGLGGDGKPVWKRVPGAGSAEASPYKVTYFRPDKVLGDRLPAMDHVFYEPGLRVRPKAGARVLARVVEPYFDRNWQHFSSHFQTAPDKETDYPAVVVAGKVGYIPYPIFSMFSAHGSIAYRQLVGACIDELIGRPRVETNAPSNAEISVMRNGKATIVHVLYYPAERRTTGLDVIEDVVPLHDVRLSVSLEKQPSKAYLAPSREPIECRWRGSRAEVVVPKVAGHQMVVFE